jgi:hypothetical protein
MKMKKTYCILLVVFLLMVCCAIDNNADKEIDDSDKELIEDDPDIEIDDPDKEIIEDVFIPKWEVWDMLTKGENRFGIGNWGNGLNFTSYVLKFLYDKETDKYSMRIPYRYPSDNRPNPSYRDSSHMIEITDIEKINDNEYIITNYVNENDYTNIKIAIYDDSDTHPYYIYYFTKRMEISVVNEVGNHIIKIPIIPNSTFQVGNWYSYTYLIDNLNEYHYWN